MKMFFILNLAVAIANPFVGVAQDEHCIVNNFGESYIENELDIHAGDVVAIVNDNVYVIDCKH